MEIPGTPLFDEPVTQRITAFKLTSARNFETETGVETPVVVIELQVLDESHQPPKEFHSRLVIGDELFEGLARRCAQMCGLSRDLWEQHVQRGKDQGREGQQP